MKVDVNNEPVIANFPDCNTVNIVQCKYFILYKNGKQDYVSIFKSIFIFVSCSCLVMQVPKYNWNLQTKATMH